MFYPARGEDQEPAVAVCRACPVRADCLEYALAGVEMFGVWGGTSERARRRMRIARNKARRADLTTTASHLEDAT
jgi:WhiB family redox-sensing transcriptional regulator